MELESLVSKLPRHLRRYIVDQDYSRYTPIDQAVWRYIMRRLTNFLSDHAHPAYMEGLNKTGIEVDRIPDIARMNDFLKKFGWQALPVSGFIPPAAFMELQSLSILPIASDMRTVDHILYTPAPDIVHEAAGHAPILVDPKFASYLKKYSQVAKKAIISSEDLELYEAIRELSDIKESPESTKEQIKNAEKHLEKVSANMTHVSEAGLLGRMNWWTAEYGLIGDLNHPKIFGAGLLSSVGEAKECLDPKIKKIPLTVDCIDYSYNITEPQPQLFVTPTFENLEKALEDLANTMAFRTGGVAGLERALQAKTINTTEFSTGLQVSGVLTKIYNRRDSHQPDYLSFTGPCTLSHRNKIIKGHGLDRHPEGFGSPVGKIVDLIKFHVGQRRVVEFPSGVKVDGVISNIFHQDGRVLIVTFQNCTVTYGNEVLFEPSWGEYDMAVGDRIVSVFGGPADHSSFDDTKDFPVKVIPRRKFSIGELALHSLYTRVREIRENNLEAEKELSEILAGVKSNFPNEWLIVLEIYELTKSQDSLEVLQEIAKKFPDKKEQIESGIEIAEKKKI
ncbi:MAG: phenylalanine 4-monooxygenase [Proteobacteria bacterium SG_bin7]|nr:MAG: phenylalanine 4-monooxygenase [Proteobacteria bacterium SG_bin7]